MNYIPSNATLSNEIYRVEITPELANRWLQHNNFNRRLRKDVVREYARCMKRGEWGESDSLITISKRGIVLNGQHRLAAVVLSGKSIWALVRFNVPLPEHLNYDHGCKRTLLDAFRLELQDDTIREKEIAVLKAVIAGHGCDNIDAWCAAELIPYYKIYAPKLNDVIDFLGEKFDTTVLAVLAKASFYLDWEHIEDFCTLLLYEEPTHPSNNIMCSFRSWLYQRKNRRIATRREIYKWTQFVLKAVIDRAKKCKLPPTSIDLFPLVTPELIKAKNQKGVNV